MIQVNLEWICNQLCHFSAHQIVSLIVKIKAINFQFMVARLLLVLQLSNYYCTETWLWFTITPNAILCARISAKYVQHFGCINLFSQSSSGDFELSKLFLSTLEPLLRLARVYCQLGCVILRLMVRNQLQFFPNTLIRGINSMH